MVVAYFLGHPVVLITSVLLPTVRPIKP